MRKIPACDYIVSNRYSIHHPLLTSHSLPILMAADEAYMVGRNDDQSQRLDAQHRFCRALALGNLIRPSMS